MYMYVCIYICMCDWYYAIQQKFHNIVNQLYSKKKSDQSPSILDYPNSPIKGLQSPEIAKG